MKIIQKLGVSLGVLVLGVSLFAGGVYASENWDKWFDGKVQAEETDDNIGKIMDIMGQVNEEKDAALNKIEGLNERIVDKESKIKELKKAVGDNTTTIQDLKADIVTLKDEIVTLNDKITGLNDEVRILNEKKGQNEATIADLKQDKINLKAELVEANASKSENEGYIDHLENELDIANEAVEGTHNKSEQALEKAQGYTEED